MNRIALLGLLLFPMLSHAAYRCDPSAAPDVIEQSFGAELERLSAAQKAAEATHEAKLSRIGDELVKSGAWSSADRARFYQDLMVDQIFAKEEKLKAKYLASFMASMEAAEKASGKDSAELCRLAEGALSIFGEIVSSNQRQWHYMENELSKVQRKGS
ncbi:hypothetical protein ACFFGH_34155 [Lysobacter korlensis]|uniref:Uncharacterized protein n=1 Tax=Lysobacter korlensis TaxID=553636 RepID=A0ABV6S236_9GAMM